MSINVVCERPRVFCDGVEVIGTTREWDYVFDALSDHCITSIRLVRQLNPGMSLVDAKQAFEAMRHHRS